MSINTETIFYNSKDRSFLNCNILHTCSQLPHENVHIVRARESTVIDLKCKFDNGSIRSNIKT